MLPDMLLHIAVRLLCRDNFEIVRNPLLVIVVQHNNAPTTQMKVVMTEVRIYHWHPAAYHTYGGGAWAILRHFLEEGEAVDNVCNVERLRSKRGAGLVDEVMNHQCEWVSGLSPIEWRECFTAPRA
eukprot:4034162-Pyramimonas_sp.AAC.1